MFATKAAIFLCLAVTIVYGNAEDVPGGVRPVTDLRDAQEILNYSLTQVAAGDGPSYKLGKIYSATLQVVAGTLYKFEADLIDNDGKTKKCKIEIWSRPWVYVDGEQITFGCPDEPVLTIRHSL